MAKKIVVVIDDDQEFADAVTNLLEANGYTVLSAPDGTKGFALVKKEQPAVILLDVMMTHKSEGFDVSRTLRNSEETKNIPIILVTGIRREMALPFGFEPDEEWLPVKTVLEKPVAPEILLKTIRELAR